MIVIPRGTVLYCFGGGMILAGFGLLFPKAFMKKEDLAKLDPEKIKGSPWGYDLILAGVVLVILGYIFKF